MIHQGNIVGAALVAVYAMAIPALKLLLIVIGFLLQIWGSATCMRWARRCIVTVRIISRWACPDMFAYILMMYLFRSLNKPPTVHSQLDLDLGFVAFCVFCVGSTISSLGLVLPAATLRKGDETKANP